MGRKANGGPSATLPTPFHTLKYFQPYLLRVDHKLRAPLHVISRAPSKGTAAQLIPRVPFCVQIWMLVHFHNDVDDLTPLLFRTSWHPSVRLLRFSSERRVSNPRLKAHRPQSVIEVQCGICLDVPSSYPNASNRGRRDQFLIHSRAPKFTTTSSFPGNWIPFNLLKCTTKLV
jgi:hypothetical protein